MTTPTKINRIIYHQSIIYLSIICLSSIYNISIIHLPIIYTSSINLYLSSTYLSSIFYLSIIYPSSIYPSSIYPSSIYQLSITYLSSIYHISIINLPICDITAHTILLYVLFCLTYMYCTLYILYILYCTCSLFPCFWCWGFIFNICPHTCSHLFTCVSLLLTKHHQHSLSYRALHHRGSVTISILDWYHFKHSIGVKFGNNISYKMSKKPNSKREIIPLDEVE